MNDLPPLPDDVQALLRIAEHGAPAPPPGIEAAILAKVTATVTAAATTTAAATSTAAVATPTLLAMKPLAAFLAGTALVATIVVGGRALLPRSTQEGSAVVAPAVVDAAPPIAALAPSVPAPAPTQAEPTMLAPTATPTTTSAPALAQPTGDTHSSPLVRSAEPARGVNPAQEAALVDAAREAIARGDGDVALRKLQEHAGKFSGGALVEERRALLVVALALRHETDRARNAAKAFEREYPSSLFLDMVHAALEDARE